MKGQEALFSKKSDEWETPQALFNRLNLRYRFTVDVAATKENAKCEKFYTKEDNGLVQSWENEIVWCNPPYSEIPKWVEKAAKFKALTTVMLLPARTDTRWFHEHIYNKSFTNVEFIRGRLKFGDSKNSAPFPSMVVIFSIF